MPPATDFSCPEGHAHFAMPVYPWGHTPSWAGKDTMTIEREEAVLPQALPVAVTQWARGLTRWDGFAVLLVLAVLIFLAEASRTLLDPLSALEAVPLSLAPVHLPEY